MITCNLPQESLQLCILILSTTNKLSSTCNCPFIPFGIPTSVPERPQIQHPLQPSPRTKTDRRTIPKLSSNYERSTQDFEPRSPRAALTTSCYLP